MFHSSVPRTNYLQRITFQVSKLKQKYVRASPSSITSYHNHHRSNFLRVKSRPNRKNIVTAEAPSFTIWHRTQTSM